jgi:hypothetical protein
MNKPFCIAATVLDITCCTRTKTVNGIGIK